MQIYFKVLLFIAIIAIEFLATTTTVHIEIVESMWDKANHFIAFFTLYVLVSFGFNNLGLLKKIMWLLLFAIQIEIVQHFIEGRFFSLLDVVADSVGILLGLIAFNIYKKYRTV